MEIRKSILVFFSLIKEFSVYNVHENTMEQKFVLFKTNTHVKARTRDRILQWYETRAQKCPRKLNVHRSFRAYRNDKRTQQQQQAGLCVHWLFENQITFFVYHAIYPRQQFA